MDIAGITRSISKYAVIVRKREDLAEIIKKAFYIAKSGKPGVVVDLPKDVQKAYGSDVYPKKITVRGYKPNTSVHMGQFNKALDILSHANKPVFLIGGGVNIAHANKEMTELAEMTGIPVITTIMGKGAIPTTSDLYIGNIGIHGSYAANSAISKCDVLFSIRTRFNDRINGKIEEFAVGAKIIQSINELFEDAVVTTDVGQNQLWTTQFLHINENKEMVTAIVYELPIIICILNNGYLGNVRQWQEMVYDRRYSGTCMRYRRSCETGCSTPDHCCPEYTPDFIALAESYGAKGIRVTKPEDIKTALISAKQNVKTPTVIEFIKDREINVMPIVPPGNSLNDMILGIGEALQ